MPVNKQAEQNHKPHSKQKIPQTKIRQKSPPFSSCIVPPMCEGARKWTKSGFELFEGQKNV